MKQNRHLHILVIAFSIFTWSTATAQQSSQGTSPNSVVTLFEDDLAIYASMLKLSS